MWPAGWMAGWVCLFLQQVPLLNTGSGSRLCPKFVSTNHSLQNWGRSHTDSEALGWAGAKNTESLSIFIKETLGKQLKNSQSWKLWTVSPCICVGKRKSSYPQSVPVFLDSLDSGETWESMSQQLWKLKSQTNFTGLVCYSPDKFHLTFGLCL